ncbi:lytic transglycosylase domain-containing protein [Phanerochaete sordida]|uniref:Lytic transglycosylase domain-containing protein n=1 Tax=Phanerochaete sordida TaxID=48140 RepID=A0A9P3GAH2_9APHY|nr:lytic transglycosylase domain-containing protein [Phanerochaete sordida]
MKLSAPFVGLVLAAAAAQAAFPHAEGGLNARGHHRRLSHGGRDLVDGLEPVKRPHRRADGTKCKPRPSSSLVSSSTAAPAKASPAQLKAVATTSAAPAPPASSPAASTSSGALKLNTLYSDACGAPGSTEQVTATTGPNGKQSYFNCGIEGSGWNPPPMTMADVVSKDLNAALSEPNSPFSKCAPYVGFFYQYGGQFNVPPIFLASIAMQESSCDPTRTGGAGEQGIMQITVDKCGGAPGGNCKDPGFNIQQGAKFLSELLSENDDNVLLSVGKYNGWVKGMTKAQATAAAYTSCCPCQNNLDYLTQFFNGWMQGVDPTGSPRIGSYFNLDICNTGQ